MPVRKHSKKANFSSYLSDMAREMGADDVYTYMDVICADGFRSTSDADAFVKVARNEIRNNGNRAFRSVQVFPADPISHNMSQRTASVRMSR